MTADPDEPNPMPVQPPSNEARTFHPPSIAMTAGPMLTTIAAVPASTWRSPQWSVTMHTPDHTRRGTVQRRTKYWCGGRVRIARLIVPRAGS